jgi:cell division control protein 6
VDFEVFEKLEEDVYSVFRDKSVLDNSFVPTELVCRGREIDYFARILTRGVAEDFLPPMIRVFGVVGSGKTVVVRSVLERFSRYRGDVFRFFYVNLKECRTVFSAANAVLSSICGRRVPVNLGLDRVFTEVWSEVKALKRGLKLFVCLVFDEVDTVFADKHFDPSDYFYRFIRHQTFLGDSDIRMCLVAITNNMRVFDEKLDGRVKSSMGNEMIVFPSYSKDELKEVLRRRLGTAFKPGVVDDGVLDCCAGLVAEKTGDARKAVDLLRVCGEIANDRKGRVTVECVKDALERVEKEWVYELLDGLPKTADIVLAMIAQLTLKKDKTSTRELFDVYKVADFKGPGNKVLSERRLLDVVKDLETFGLVNAWNVSRGRGGYGKELKLNVNPQSVLFFYKYISKRGGLALKEV